MADLPPYLSVTQVTTYLGCPRKYKFRYVEHRDPERRSGELAFGSAVHSAIEWWATCRMAGKSCSLEAVLRIFRVDWHAQISAGDYHLDDKTPEEYATLGAALVRLFYERFHDQVPTESESRFEVALREPETGDTLPVNLVGFFDLAWHGVLGEIKTTAKKASPDTWGLQLAAYSYAWRERTGTRPRLRVVELIKTKTPKLEIEELTLTDRDEAWSVEVAVEAYRSIVAGAFHPNPSWMCGRCEYRKACRRAE